FDYYDGVTTDMGAAAISAAQGLFDQLRILYPAKADAELWGMEGNTILPGIDDYPRKTEATYPADAQRLYDFATAKGIDTLSIWAIQRDNGGARVARRAECPANDGRTATARPRRSALPRSSARPSSHAHESRDRRACVTSAISSRGTASATSSAAIAGSSETVNAGTSAAA